MKSAIPSHSPLHFRQLDAASDCLCSLIVIRVLCGAGQFHCASDRASFGTLRRALDAEFVLAFN
ncbi:hypothetical protein DPM33_32980 [Mesorhizobium hawassense]|uniref:Uncharacterized protein n=1 Tax=Mesorhizobium hawassense TaxID=1209954 RepID=A0A330H947_9HYPH|nr:hypothetical protein [Mesorhizobium hawassense]RAZ83199.1 hypothetical protein DPM33_32980 [Mesorhizobium hawassense]